MTESETSRRIGDRAMMSDHASVKTIGNTEAVEVAILIEVAVEGEMIEAVNGEMVAEASAAVSVVMSVETGAMSAGMGAMSVEMLSVNHRMTAVHHIMVMMTEPDRHVVPILTRVVKMACLAYPLKIDFRAKLDRREHFFGNFFKKGVCFHRFQGKIIFCRLSFYRGGGVFSKSQNWKNKRYVKILFFSSKSLNLILFMYFNLSLFTTLILTMMIDEEIETIDEIVKSNSPGDSKSIRKIFFLVVSLTDK